MKPQLQAVLSTIQQRHGNQSIRPLQSLKQIQVYRTGYAALDTWTGIGGMPRGHITELQAGASSGAHTIALRTIAMAQQEQTPIMVIQPERVFDPLAAEGCGVQVDYLYFASPQHLQEALAITVDVIRGVPAGLIMLDLPETWYRKAAHQRLWRQVQQELHHSHSAIIQLTISAASHAHVPAGLRLRFERRAWIYNQQQDVIGYQVDVHMLKHRFAGLRPPLELAILIDSTGIDG